jgi:hypothetical protein
MKSEQAEAKVKSRKKTPKKKNSTLKKATVKSKFIDMEAEEGESDEDSGEDQGEMVAGKYFFINLTQFVIERYKAEDLKAKAQRLDGDFVDGL